MQKNSKESKKSKKVNSKKADRYRGGNDDNVEEDNEEIKLMRSIKEYQPDVDDDIQTKIYYYDSPDEILELLEQYVSMKVDNGDSVQL